MTRNGENLQDLVPDILLKLAVKSLMRFKCVQKSWCHLIQDPNFVSKHYVSFNEMNLKYDHHLLVQGMYTNNPDEDYTRQEKDPCFISMISFDQTTNIMSSPKFLDLKQLEGYTYFRGPCNGIYFLESESFYIFLNPSMREFRAIPFPKTNNHNLMVPGFGFDAKANDYKVVVIFNENDDKRLDTMPCGAAIYRLNSKSDGWRDVLSPVPYYGHVNSQPTPILHGACHWLVSEAYMSDNWFFIGFDMVDEVFQRINLPNGGSDGYDLVEMFEFKECASVIYVPYDRGERCIKVWVMEEYGNEESWTKYFSIGPILEVRRPLGIWRNNEIVVVDEQGVVASCNPHTLEIEDLGFHGEPWHISLAIYKESLVSLRGDDPQNQAGVYSFAIVRDQVFEMRFRSRSESQLWSRIYSKKMC